MLRSLTRPPFWLLALLSLATYATLPFLFPLIPHYAQAPLLDVRSFTPTLAGGIGYALLFLLLYALYVLAWQSLPRRNRSLLTILALAALFALPLIFTYPLNATDLFRYFVRGRVTAVYGESSLAVPPDAFPQDPFLPLAGDWAGETSPYGPVWELIAAGITLLSGQNLLAGLLAFKGLGLATHLGIGGLIWHLTSDWVHGRRAAATLLWTWNPALLYIFVVDGHNDGLMLFWLLLGLWLMRRRRPLPGFLLAVLAPLTKPIGLLPLPFLLLHHLRGLPTWRRRMRHTLLAGAGALGLTALAFLPFGSPLELTLRLVRETSEAAGFSPGVLLVLLAQRADLSLPLAPVATAGLAIFTALALWLLWRTWQGRPALRAAADVFAGYLLTALTFRIWYSAWLFPWLLLDKEGDRRRMHAGLWFLLTTQLSVVLYGHLRAFLLSGDQLLAHLIGVPFTFGLPLLLARVLTRPPAK